MQPNTGRYMEQASQSSKGLFSFLTEDGISKNFNTYAQYDAVYSMQADDWQTPTQSAEEHKYRAHNLVVRLHFVCQKGTSAYFKSHFFRVKNSLSKMEHRSAHIWIATFSYIHNLIRMRVFKTSMLAYQLLCTAF